MNISETYEQFLKSTQDRSVAGVLTLAQAIVANRPTVTAGLPDVLTIDEAASMLRMHHSTIRQMVKDGRLRHSQTGGRKGRIRLLRSDVERLAKGDVSA